MADNVVENLIQFIPQVKGSGFQQLNKGMKSVHRNLFSLRNMFGAFFGYDLYSSVRNLIPELVHTSQLLGAMKSRFNAVSTSASAGADELNWVGEQSKRLGLDFLRTADDYSIFFATVSKNMGQGTTRKVFEQWAEAFRVLHIDPERQTRVLYALREMSSKGKIYMQDLALQLGSAVPDAMNIAAKSMGYVGPKAVERFRKAIKGGAIDVKKFIPLFSEAINKQYVSQNALNYAMEQTDAQLQLINTHWQFMQKKLLESGMQKDIVNFLKGVNSALGFLEAHAGGIYKWIKIIGRALAFILIGRGVSGLMTMFAVVTKLIPKISSIARLLVMLRGVFATLVGSPFAKLLFRLLGLGGGAGWYVAIVAGLGAILAWILKKFFPNVYNNIYGWWLDFKYDVIQFMGRLMETPFMQMLTKFFGDTSREAKDKIKENQKQGGFFKGGTKITSESPIMPKEPARNYIGGMRLTRQGIEKVPEYGPPIRINKIDASIHIDGTGIDNPEKAAQVIRDATENTYSKIMKNIARSIPGSKSTGLPPFSLLGALNK